MSSIIFIVILSVEIFNLGQRQGYDMRWIWLPVLCGVESGWRTPQRALVEEAEMRNREATAKRLKAAVNLVEIHNAAERNSVVASPATQDIHNAIQTI